VACGDLAARLDRQGKTRDCRRGMTLGLLAFCARQPFGLRLALRALGS